MAKSSETDVCKIVVGQAFQNPPALFRQLDLSRKPLEQKTLDLSTDHANR